MWKSIVLAIIIFCSYVNSFSQEDVRHDLKMAKKEYNFGNYIDALPYYINLSKAQPDVIDFYFKLGVCYLNVNSFPEALYNIEKYKSLVDNKSIDKHFHFWYARALHLNDKFDEAIEEYTVYTAESKSHIQISEYDNLYVNQVLIAKKLKSTPVEGVRVSNLGKVINSEYNEYNGIFSRDWATLYFTSDRPIDYVKSVRHQHPERVFTSTRVNYGNWSVPELVPGVLNDNPNVSCVELIDNDSTMLVHKEGHYGDLFTCKKSDSGWVGLEPMEMINSWGVEDDAFMTQDGKKIIFSSDINSSNGDLDLYIVELMEDSTWSLPKSLGNMINTRFDEDSPFLTEDGKTLYFCSNSNLSMGGFDIFKSEMNPNGTWGAPMNMGYPYNSPANDINFYVDDKKGVAIFSSQRAGGYGEMDLYVVELK